MVDQKARDHPMHNRSLAVLLSIADEVWAWLSGLPYRVLFFGMAFPSGGSQLDPFPCWGDA
jgi:hypothetical protein